MIADLSQSSTVLTHVVLGLFCPQQHRNISTKYATIAFSSHITSYPHPLAFHTMYQFIFCLVDHGYRYFIVSVVINAWPLRIVVAHVTAPDTEKLAARNRRHDSHSYSSIDENTNEIVGTFIITRFPCVTIHKDILLVGNIT